MAIIYKGRRYENVEDLPEDVRRLAETCASMSDDQVLMVVEEVGEQVRIRVIGTQNVLRGMSDPASAPTQDGHAN